MSQRPPIPQVQIESEILRLSSLLEGLTDEIADRAERAATADAAFKAMYASRFLMADGAVGHREQQAQSECEDEYRERRIAEALLLAAQEQARNLRAQLSALQSLAANQRLLVAS